MRRRDPRTTPPDGFVLPDLWVGAVPVTCAHRPAFPEIHHDRVLQNICGLREHCLRINGVDQAVPSAVVGDGHIIRSVGDDLDRRLGCGRSQDVTPNQVGSPSRQFRLPKHIGDLDALVIESTFRLEQPSEPREEERR